MISTSVIVTTARYGSFQMLVDSLFNQSMPHEDFELIVVDELFEERKGLLDNLGLNVKHMPPRVRHSYYDNGHGWNTGLRAAEGTLVTFIIDFCWLYEDFLSDHWRHYKTHGNSSMSGFIDRFTPPPLRQWNSTDEILYSIFDEPIFGSWFEGKEPEYRERKGGAGILLPDGNIEMPPDKVYMLNDSLPLALLKELNGWDEALDDSYGSNDLDLAVRANMLGWKFILNPQSIIQKFGTPTTSQVFPGVRKPKSRPPEDNYRIFVERMAAIREGRESIEVPSDRGAWIL